MYQRNGNNIGDAINFSENGLPVEFDPGEMQFIPYYVGIGDSTPIFKRLLKHSKPRNGDAEKFIRLSHDYMKEFFVGFPNKLKFTIFPHFEFPIKINRVKNNDVALNLINSAHPPKITYFNSGACLSAIYPGITPTGITRVYEKTGKVYTNYPITEQIITPSPANRRGYLPDSLSDLIIDKNNFWFCYSLNPDDKPLTQLETYTFWSLKGLTTGETNSFESINDVSHKIIAPPRLNIFKGYCTNSFPGYI